MRQRLITCEIGCVLLSILLLCPHIFADQWPLPNPEKYFSAKKTYYLEVVPRQLESPQKYWSEMAQGKQDAGSPEELTDNYCKGTLYKLDADKGYQQEWSVPLANDVSPVNALVSDNGEYVVTFDNWHSLGYGDEVVVIYGPDGAMIRKFGLEDILSKEEISRIPFTMSSIPWGRDHYLDEKGDLLVLKVVSNGKAAWDPDADFKEIKIDLSTGKLTGDETEKGPGTARASRQSLQLTITSDKEVYVVGEEISVTANIKNPGDDTAKIYSPAYWGVSEITVTNSNGIVMKPKEIKIERASFDLLLTIPSQSSAAYTFDNLTWFHCGGAWQFTSDAALPPDTYTIYVTVTNPKCAGARILSTDLAGVLTSNTITVKIKERGR